MSHCILTKFDLRIYTIYLMMILYYMEDHMLMLIIKYDIYTAYIAFINMKAKI
jgi:hypothetical protein